MLGYTYNERDRMLDWTCTTEEFFSFEGLAADDSWLEDDPPSFFQE